MSSLINTAEMVCDCVELSQLNCLLFPFADRVFVRCTSAGNRGTGLVISDDSHLMQSTVLDLKLLIHQLPAVLLPTPKF